MVRRLGPQRALPLGQDGQREGPVLAADARTRQREADLVLVATHDLGVDREVLDQRSPVVHHATGGHPALPQDEHQVQVRGGRGLDPPVPDRRGVRSARVHRPGVQDAGGPRLELRDLEVPILAGPAREHRPGPAPLQALAADLRARSRAAVGPLDAAGEGGLDSLAAVLRLGGGLDPPHAAPDLGLGRCRRRAGLVRCGRALGDRLVLRSHEGPHPRQGEEQDRDQRDQREQGAVGHGRLSRGRL